jgi:hypothetical protein
VIACTIYTTAKFFKNNGPSIRLLIYIYTEHTEIDRYLEEWYRARSVRPSSLFSAWLCSTYLCAGEGGRGKVEGRYEEKTEAPLFFRSTYQLRFFFYLWQNSYLWLTDPKKMKDGRTKDTTYFLLLLRMTDWALVSLWCYWRCSLSWVLYTTETAPLVVVWRGKTRGIGK